MKLPIRQVPGTTPPQFEWYQLINRVEGGTQAIKHSGMVASSMEAALCDLIRIAQQLAAENKRLKI